MNSLGFKLVALFLEFFGFFPYPPNFFVFSLESGCVFSKRNRKISVFLRVFWGSENVEAVNYNTFWSFMDGEAVICGTWRPQETKNLEFLMV